MARRGGIGLIAAASALSTFILPALADEARRPQPGGNGRSPAVNYMTQCQGCHLPDGRGRPGQVPALNGQLQHFLASDEGRRFLVQVPGSANARLSDADLAAVLNWMIRTMSPLRDGGFAAYSAGEVARYRVMKLDNIPARRAAIVARFPQAHPSP